MENSNSDLIDNLINLWKTASLSKKILLVIASFVLCIITVVVWSNLYYGTSTGLTSSSIGMSPDFTQKTSLPRQEQGPLSSDYVVNSDAESFETTEYSVRIETNNLKDTCKVISNLKPKPGVVFISTISDKTTCSFEFKVINSETESVLTTIEYLNPKDLRQNIYTIKKQLENSLNQRDILNQNLLSTETVLNDALIAYDNLLAAAAAERNSTALTTAVRDKIELIDMLKQRREQTRQQIDQLNHQLAEQQDRQSYTYFSVNVREQKYFDSEQITDSWKEQFRWFVEVVNDVLQGITLVLIAFVLNALRYAVYIIIVLIIAKLGWRIVRRIGRR